MGNDEKTYKQKPRNVGPNRVNEKPKNLKLALRKLLHYMKRYIPFIVIALILATLSSILVIIGPNKLSDLTNEITNGLMGGINFDSVKSISLFLLIIYLMGAVFDYLQGFIMSTVSNKFAQSLRTQISKKINALPLRYFDKHSYGDILSRVTNDVDTINMTLQQSLCTLIGALTLFIGSIIMMFYTNWILALTGIISSLIGFIFMFIILAKSQKYFKTQQEYLGYVNGQVEEVYSGHNVMKAFNAEEREINKFAQLNDTLYNSAWKSQFLSGMMMPIMTFVGNLGYVIVSILGGWLAIKKVIEVGDILSFVQYIRSFMQPIAQTAQIANVLQSTAAAAERVFEFLDEEEETLDIKNPVSTKEIVGKVDFQDVHFGYNSEKTIINDFTAHIKPGQRVAIVGPTGAGKTTMVKLLMRFYDVNDGAILIDGHNIKDFKRNDLRKMFGMVLQDTWLFNGTIMENLRYGRLDATDEEVKEAAKAAHVHSFIKTLPHGYDMELNEEASNISQGQKQLLTIARAILADPKILILDEATSSVDTRTEVLIQKAMDNLMNGRTSFIIAHRLSTIRDADLILVMKDGDIVEQGNHNELLAKGGFYANLYNSQFEAAEA